MREGMLGIILPDQIVLQRERSDDFPVFSLPSQGFYGYGDTYHATAFPYVFHD